MLIQMKQRVVIWLAVFLMATSALWAQDVRQGVTAAFSKGAPRELANILGDEVNVIIQGKMTRTDRQGAQKALTAFFTDNPVQGFKLNHEGKRDEYEFMIGTLTTGNGTWRVHCFFKKEQNQYCIHQIRIDPNNE